MSDRASRRADVKARPIWRKGALNRMLIAPLLQIGHAQTMIFTHLILLKKNTLDGLLFNIYARPECNLPPRVATTR